MRRFLALAAALAVSTAVHATLACEGAGVDQPIAVRSQGELLVAQANQLETLAAADANAALAADQEILRLTTRAQQLRIEARRDALVRVEFLTAASDLDARASVSRSRAMQLRSRAATRRMQAAELRLQAQQRVAHRRPTRTSV
jgi:hypothetical protein